MNGRDNDLQNCSTGEALQALAAAIAEQPTHPVLPKVRVRVDKGQGADLQVWVAEGMPQWTQEGVLQPAGRWLPISMDGAGRVLQERAESIHKMAGDPFNHGFEPPAWDEIDWEICRLRVRNPGVVIQPAVFGANGSGKTFYASSRTMYFLAQSTRLVAWSFAMDETNSEAINQQWMRYYLPLEYKSAKGSANMRFSEKGGFTNNKFSLHNGSRCEYRFYSKDIESNEGVRPAMAWLDEEFPDVWLDAVERRLLTYAGRTWEHIPMWKALLEEKRKNPALKFPREKLGLLLLGVQLITFTCKKGYTPTVRAFVKGAKTVRHVPNGAVLLPKKNAQGEPDGFETAPKLQYCEDPKRIIYYLHAWDNPFGGNWEGMQIMARKKARKEILWWCYGITEETSGVMWPKFSRRAHVRPLWFMPPKGTWYHIADPNDGKRNWTMAWAKVNTMRQKFIAREWPQQDDFIPGEGHVGPWAELPKGKRVDGDVGPAQRTFGRGFQFIVDEIARMERILHWQEQRLAELRRDGVKNQDITWDMLRAPILGPDAKRITVERRFMDARAGNTETLTHGAAKTLIEVMEDDYDLEFWPVDKDHGAVEGGNKTVGHGAKLVEHAFSYDDEAATVDEETGLLTFRGAAPLLYICGGPPPKEGEMPPGCENIIFACETWTYQDGGEGACKDMADLVRYLEMMDVEDMTEAVRSSDVRDGARAGAVRKFNEIGDWTARTD